ncbi:MAG: flagellar basal body P-ring protein FlgI [Alphaproteobacteria bacterium]
MHRLTCLVLAVTLVIGSSLPAQAASTRIKDIVNVEGVRDNLLVGYGIVVGLNGTGDNLNSSPFTEQSLLGMLERLGINVRDADLKTKNVAAVMVTSTLPPFARQGSRIDVTVSALGDASDLQGGTLLVTPLMGADGDAYAVAQGTVATAAFQATGEGAAVTRGVPTGGRIANGAIIGKEIDFKLNSLSGLTLSLRNPDFTTASRIAAAINGHMGGPMARAEDPGTVRMLVPEPYKGNVVALMTEIEALRVNPDQVARVVIDEASGTIVMGADVRISTVAIAQGNLTIRITEQPQVSQPGAFAEVGETVQVPRTDVEVDDDSDRRIAVLKSGISLQELVQGLNALGVGPRDVITILQAIKASGAMQAEIEVL